MTFLCQAAAILASNPVVIVFEWRNDFHLISNHSEGPGDPESSETYVTISNIIRVSQGVPDEFR